jgi:hypothetical protein
MLVMLHCLDCGMQEDDLSLVMNTTDAVTSRCTNTRAYFQCTKYDAAGAATTVNCSAGNIKQCAQNGTMGCTLHYTDINVTSVLKAGKTVWLCNAAWKEFVAFNKVAYIKDSALAVYTGPGGGSNNTITIPETEAYALVQVLRAVDSNVTVDWAISKTIVVSGCNKAMAMLRTASGYTVSISWRCSSGLFAGAAPNQVLQENVIGLSMTVEHGPQDPLRRYPALDDHLVTALMSLPRLADLELTVGLGSLLPQLGALEDMSLFDVRHYCVRHIASSNHQELAFCPPHNNHGRGRGWVHRCNQQRAMRPPRYPTQQMAMQPHFGIDQPRQQPPEW